MGSCQVYPSVAQTFQAYDRSTPLAADSFAVTSTLANCEWDTVNHCLVCINPTRVRISTLLLWQTPPDGYWLGALIMKNELGTAAGAPGGEIGGGDIVSHQPSPEVNISNAAERIVDLVAGDKLWVVPCCIQGESATLTNAVASNGQNTVNYVIVIEID